VAFGGLTDKQRPSAANGLDADSFEAICFAVSEKLRHEYRQSKTWAVETADEMVDQAYIEYAEKSEAEQDEVRSLAGLLITTAVRRSLDKARKEGREIFGEGAQAVIDNAEDQTPSTEVLAVRGIEAAELYEAVQGLHHEQREALSLLYWGGFTTREAAERMGVGTMTVCRRRDDAMDSLRAFFGLDADDPTLDKHLGKEAGFSAWAGLMVGGGGHALSSAAEQIVAGADTTRHGVYAVWHGFTGTVGRARDLALRVFSSGGGEGVGGAISSGSAGGLAKLALYACRGAVGTAAVYCAAGAVGVGPGAGLFHGGDSHPASRGALVRPHVSATTPPVERAKPAPSHSPTQGTNRTTHRRHGRHSYVRRRDRAGRVYTKQSEAAVRSQSLESASSEPEAAPEPAPEPEPTYVGEPEGGGSEASESAAQQQFGLP